MKKLLALILATALALSLVACGGGGNDTGGSGTSGSENSSLQATSKSTDNEKEETQYYQLGDTVSTDILDFTLLDCKFAIYASATLNETYLQPVEESTMYGAKVGHSLAIPSFTITNKDRSGNINIGANGGELSWSISYGDKEWFLRKFGLDDSEPSPLMSLSPGAIIDPNSGNMIEKHDAMNYLLDAGETISFRTIGVLVGEPENYNDEFKFNVEIPTSSGSKTSFTYIVTEEGRLKLEEERRSAEEEEARLAQEAENEHLAAIAPIDEALQGAWTHDQTTITFADGRFTYDYIRVSDGKREVNEGNYEIGETTITLAYDSGNSPEIDYTFEDGVLSLFGEVGVPPVQFNYIKQG